MILKTQKNLNGMKKVWKKDIDEMERTVKAMKRSRRHFKVKHMARLQKEELDLEDILSSSSESPNKNEKSITGKESEERFNFPRMALGGVPIMENGEPLGGTIAEEWVSEYGGASSQESEGFLNFAHNHDAYINAKDTIERNV